MFDNRESIEGAGTSIVPTIRVNVNVCGDASVSSAQYGSSGWTRKWVQNLDGQEVGGDAVTPEKYSSNLSQKAADKSEEEADIARLPAQHAYKKDRCRCCWAKYPGIQKNKAKRKQATSPRNAAQRQGARYICATPLKMVRG